MHARSIGLALTLVAAAPLPVHAHGGSNGASTGPYGTPALHGSPPPTSSPGPHPSSAARRTGAVDRGPTIAPLLGARVDAGWVIAGELSHDGERAALAGTIELAGAEGETRTLRVAAHGVDLGNGFSLLVGGFVQRATPMVGATTQSFMLAGVRYHRAFVIERDGFVEVLVDATATLGAVQRTRAAASHLREVDGGLRLCASQSDVGVAVGVRIAETVEVRAGWELQDDPFHFDEGYGCLGDGPIWARGETLSGSAHVQVTDGVRLGIVIVHRTAGLGWDVPGVPRTRGLASVRDTAVMTALEISM